MWCPGGDPRIGYQVKTKKKMNKVWILVNNNLSILTNCNKRTTLM